MIVLHDRRSPAGAMSPLCVALIVAAVFLVPLVATAEEPAASSSNGLAPSSTQESAAIADPSITLRGSVWRTKAGIVFLKTPIGLLTLSSKTTLKDLKASQEVLFWVHEHSSVVDIRKRTDGALVHRYLTGPLTFGPDDSKTLRWWTPDGEETTHHGTQEERLSAYHEGDMLTVEVDESHTIIGVHDLQYDLQISQVPPSGSEAQLYLSGTVSKLKSNFVFFRTLVGMVMVNAKIGVPHVKVGQAMTLQVDGPHIQVDVGSASSKRDRANAGPVPSLAPAP